MLSTDLTEFIRSVPIAIHITTDLNGPTQNGTERKDQTGVIPKWTTYSVYRKDRNIHGGGAMLLAHKDISHMPITELENDSESIWVKVFAYKTSHFVASWYRLPGSTSEEFQLFR